MRDNRVANNHVADLSQSARLHLTQASRALVAVVVGNVITVVVLNIFWPHAVTGFFVGWCSAWLAAVAWVRVQEARDELSSRGPSDA